MGLCYETTRWLDRLWSEHLDMSAPARERVQAGVEKQGDSFAGFPADLHARLYLLRDPPTKEGPQWAFHLHELASELAEWQRLRQVCARNGFAAGVAAQAMLQALLADGEDELEPETVEAAREMTRTEGVSWFVVGVGRSAATVEAIDIPMIADRDTTAGPAPPMLPGCDGYPLT